MLIAQVDRVEIERRLEFAALPEGWAAVGLLAVGAALAWAIVWMYRREGRAGASPRVRMIMAGLRCAVLACLFAVWLQPVLATYLHRLVDSYTLVLVDTSSSMDLQDRYRHAEHAAQVKAVLPDANRRPVRRTELVDQILSRSDHRFLRDLTAQNRVKLFTFAETAQAEYTLRAVREARFRDVAATPEPNTAPEIAADDVAQAPTNFDAQGPATDLGKALRLATESLGRAPVAGVVILTDGGLNRGDAPDAVARYAAEKKLPLHIIGLGDPAPPHNVRVAEVIAPDNVFAEDPFAVVAQIAGQGMAGESVAIELRERRADSDDAERVVATETVTLGADNTVEPVTFQRRQKTVGRWVYRVHVPVGETESVADDNAKQVAVSVIENKLRVLLLAGAPSWEYRYLSRLLERDDTFELSCWLQSADMDAVRDGNVIINHLPATAEELFNYDAVVMLDPDPLEITGEWAALANAFVHRHGGGLLYAAARLHAPGFLRDPAVEDIVKMLPVAPDPDAELILNQIGHYQERGYPLIVPSSALGHPALKLPDAPSGLNWANIGRVYWHFPVLREKPVASVLMRHGDPRMQNAYGPHVLFATQYVGAGRTAFLGFDGTWRWRAPGEAIFNTFWVQTIRYLVEGKLAGGNRRGMLLTERDTYQLGEPVLVTARLFDQAFQPLQVEEVAGEIRLGGETKPLSLERLTDRPGWYEGRFVPAQTGACELVLPIPGADLEQTVARREIQIVRPNLEILQPQLNRPALQRIAEQSPGGRYYDVDAADMVPGQIPDRHESTTIRSRPVPLWDDAWVLALLVALLAAEWTLRKVYRLL